MAMALAKTHRTDQLKEKMRLAMIGDSGVQPDRLDYSLFPREYNAVKGSYKAFATRYYEERGIGFVLDYRIKPEIVVLMFGGNDVAWRRGSGPPPTNSYIAKAIIQTAYEVIRRGVLVEHSMSRV